MSLNVVELAEQLAEDDVHGSLEETQAALQELNGIVFAKPSPVEGSSSFRAKLAELAHQRQQLDPVLDKMAIIQIEQQQKNLTELEQVVESLSNKYTSIISRLKNKPVISNGWSDLIIERIWGKEQSQLPSYEEMVDFIEAVYKAKSRDYGSDVNANEVFAELIGHTNDLTRALSISLRLKELDEKVTRDPFTDLAERKKILLVLSKLLEEYKGFFIDLGKAKHPFNLRLWLIWIKKLQQDMDALSGLDEQVRKMTLRIDNAEAESELPTSGELKALTDTAIRLFGMRTSARRSAALYEIAQLESAVKQIKQQKTEQAKAEFAAISNQFEQWKSTVEDITKAFSTSQSNGFPWMHYPPSQLEVDALQDSVVLLKQKYQQWPCTEPVIPTQPFQLPFYSKILETMKHISEKELDKAFTDPNFSIQQIQQYIKVYKNLLVKGGYSDADELIASYQMRLFLFAHQQQRQGQWFQFFRRSYYDDLQQVNWSDIAANAHSANFGYKGERTKKVLEMLGWLEEGEATNLAPTIFTEFYNQPRTGFSI